MWLGVNTCLICYCHFFCLLQAPTFLSGIRFQFCELLFIRPRVDFPHLYRHRLLSLSYSEVEFLIALMHISTYDGQGMTLRLFVVISWELSCIVTTCTAPVLTLSRLKIHSVYIDDHMVAWFLDLTSSWWTYFFSLLLIITCSRLLFTNNYQPLLCHFTSGQTALKLQLLSFMFIF